MFLYSRKQGSVFCSIKNTAVTENRNTLLCHCVCPIPHATALPRPQSLSLCCLIHSHCSVHIHTHTKHACLFPYVAHSQTRILYIHRHSSISSSFSFLCMHTITRTLQTLAERRLAAQHSPTTYCKLQINQPWAWLALMCVCLCVSGTKCVWAWVRNLIFLAFLLALFSDSREKRRKNTI